MTFIDLILSRRSIRQFKPDSLPREILVKLVDAARLAPSAANLQPLEYVIISGESIRKKVFSCLRWAAYIAPEGNPQPGHEPTAYAVILVNTKIRDKGFERDAGAAAENLILAARDYGIGSCWINSVDRSLLQETLSVPESHIIDSVIALGYPDESPRVEDMTDSVKYWKDKSGQFHVPKRKLEDVIHFNTF